MTLFQESWRASATLQMQELLSGSSCYISGRPRSAFLGPKKCTGLSRTGSSSRQNLCDPQPRPSLQVECTTKFPAGSQSVDVKRRSNRRVRRQSQGTREWPVVQGEERPRDGAESRTAQTDPGPSGRVDGEDAAPSCGIAGPWARDWGRAAIDMGLIEGEVGRLGLLAVEGLPTSVPPVDVDGVAKDVTGMSIYQLLASDDVFSKELSWLSYLWRVMHMSMDLKLPLFERLRLLGLVSSNLDEFFESRVGSLKLKDEASEGSSPTLQGPGLARAGSRTVSQQRDLICRAVHDLKRTYSAVLQGTLMPELEAQGVLLQPYKELPQPLRAELRDVFVRELEPLLTPLAVDPGHPFPRIRHLALNLAVLLQDPLDGNHRFAIVTLPQNVPRTRRCRLGDEEVVVLLEQVVMANLGRLFGGMEVLSVHAFRATRAVHQLEDKEELDLMRSIRQQTHKRQFAPFVRLQVDAHMPPALVEQLAEELGLEPTREVFRVDGPLAMGELQQLATLMEMGAAARQAAGLVFQRWTPQPHPQLLKASLSRPASVFEAISAGELLLHHPYQSFSATTLLLLEAAARDPQVVAVKAILYHAAVDSAPVAALVAAAEAGKEVTALVELKARNREAGNCALAQRLGAAGVNVAYGVPGLVTHAKALLIVRREGAGLRSYCHIGTGDYHAGAAASYDDVALLSAAPALGRALGQLFKFLTGRHRLVTRRRADEVRLLVGPGQLRAELLRLCAQEGANARKGLPAGITVKVNALDDKGLSAQIYRAAAAGANVQLIVRGLCRVRAGVEGLTSRVRVVSVTGRFLEHSRILRFENGGKPLYFLSSADWTSRDLSSRVELAVRVDDPKLQAELDDILGAYLSDTCTAWEMSADGKYQLRQCALQQDPELSELYLQTQRGGASRVETAPFIGVQAAHMEAARAAARKKSPQLLTKLSSSRSPPCSEAMALL